MYRIRPTTTRRARPAMEDPTMNLLRACRLPLLLVLVVAASPLVADAQPGPDPEVRILIQRGPEPTLQVVPSEVAICKRAGAECGGAVTWLAQPGAAGPQEGELLVIRHKPSDEPSRGCFASETFEIDAAGGSVSSGAVAEACAVPISWYYSVELWMDGTMITELDPRVIIGPAR